jgi:hypothetical protein
MAKFGKSIPAEDPPPPPVVEQPVVVTVAPQTPPPADTPVQEFSVPEAPTEPKAEEHWMKSMWRPAMGWLYMIICFMDFVAFPAIAMFLPVLLKGAGLQMQYVAWQSLTLSNGGLIHMAFGAILGVAAYGRTQEKVASKQ